MLLAVSRPSSGVVVIGWVDYNGDPPTDLAGTPSTRVPRVNFGATPVDYAFVAINEEMFRDLPADPQKALGDLPNNYNLAAKMMPQRVPKALKDQMLEAIEENILAALQATTHCTRCGYSVHVAIFCLLL